jgi:hypothetical protein
VRQANVGLFIYIHSLTISRVLREGEFPERVFVLKKILPAGMAFPYDFGFVPSSNRLSARFLRAVAQSLEHLWNKTLNFEGDFLVTSR